MPGSTPHHTDKWRSCVQKVGDKSPDVDPYAVCTAQLGPSIEASDTADMDDYECSDCGRTMKFNGQSRCFNCGSPVDTVRMTKR